MMMVLGDRRASSASARRERVVGERGTARKRTEAVVRRVVKGTRWGVLVAEEKKEEVLVLSFLRVEMMTFMPTAVQRRAMCFPS